MTYDVLTIGEALVRLTPPHHKRFEQSNTVEWHIGGSEMNTAVGLARLGCDVAWVSRLTDNVIGRLIAQTLRAQNVDTAHLIWTDEDRIGTYYMEEGIGTRPSEVTYDRAHSSMSRLTPDDIDTTKLLLPAPKLFHTTGITLALSDSTAQVIHKIAEACVEREIPISFDINYRAKLWDTKTAKVSCQPLMAMATLIFIPQRDAIALFGTDDISALGTQFPNATLVMTKGAQGAETRTPAGEILHHGIFPTETVCRVGGGDAFAAGFLYAYINDMPPDKCLRYASAVASLKYSLAGDMPLVDKQQVERLVQSGASSDIVR